MTTTLVTIICTVILVLLAIAVLSIGLILTGKTRIRAGSCRMRPVDPKASRYKKTDDCDAETTCALCQMNCQNELDEKERTSKCNEKK